MTKLTTWADLERKEAARYGRLAIVAINFHIQTGNPAELRAAYVYAKLAAERGRMALESTERAR